MSSFVTDLLGELVESYETQIEGDIRIGLVKDAVVISPHIKATVVNKKSNKNEFLITLSNQSKIQIGGLAIPIAFSLKNNPKKLA